MPNSDQEHRSSCSMEDSAMTIEFLRARLLAERSVSKSARQRAEELAKRVDDLEEQLRFVSLQRKMAEKATVDVLNILENRGISDTSETYDSSSDQETHGESQPQVGNTNTNSYSNGEESKRRSESEQLSGSDLDSSPMTGRSLSWNGRSKSHEKYKVPSMRRRNAYSSIHSSSPKHHLAKSCRQIRQNRETRAVPVVEEQKTESLKFDSQENGAANATKPEGCSDTRPKTVREGSEIQKKLLEDPISDCLENQSVPSHLDLDVNSHGQDKDMEKALQDQAQLIGRYEEMEKAQREWEDKFRENNTSTPDSYDPGNRSDITEERDDVKAQMLYNNGIDVSEAEMAKSEEMDVPKETSNGFLPPSNVEVLNVNEQTSNSANSVGSRFQAQEFSFPTEKENENQESQENHDYGPESHHRDPLLCGPVGHQSSEGSSSDAGSSSQKRDASESPNDLYALVPHKPADALGGVLDALKHAKLSLQEKIHRLPPDSTTVNTAIEPSPPATRIGDRTEIPVGCTGLFRLPTDFAIEEASRQANFRSLGSHLPLAPYYSHNGVTITTPDRFVTNPYFENQSGYSDYGVTVTTPDRFVTTPYIENQSGFPADVRFITSSSILSGSRASTPFIENRSGFPTDDRFVRSSSVASGSRAYIENRPGYSTDNRFISSSSVMSGTRASTLNSSYLDSGLSSVNRYNYSPHPSYPPFPDLMPRVPSPTDERLLRTFPGSRSDGLPFDNDHVRPNMYRY